MKSKLLLLFQCLLPTTTLALIPFLDGGKQLPKLYDCYFNDQLAKQAKTAVSNALAAGKTNIEVNFSPVPNLDEVKFGTPLNQKFGKLVARDLNVPNGYKPGSNIARQQVGYANIYWAKQLAAAMNGIVGERPVTVVTAEPVGIADVRNKKGIAKLVGLGRQTNDPAAAALVCVNPGGEETWQRLRTALAKPKAPCVMLNSAYSTTYGLGNKVGYEEAYYLKRISKGFVYRAFPGPWYVGL